MPGRIGWYIKDHIILVQIKGHVTDQEYIAFASHPRLAEALNQSPSLFVHYFFEVMDSQTILPGLSARGKTRAYSHKKDGWAILINFNLNPLWRMTASILAQASRSRSRFVSSYEEGFNVLKHVDETIPRIDPQIEWLFDVNWEPSPLETLSSPGED